jgi:nucleoid-associated protein YgaU
MSQRIRLLAAAAVMLVGLGIALVFRRPSAETELPISLQSDPLVLRQQPDARALAAAEPASSTQARPQNAAPAEPRRLSPTVVTPSDQPAPPPDLPKSFPSGSQSTSNQPASTRWGSSLGEMLPATASAPTRHKVVDGDTLDLLAERYLGSATRAMEIFEANRSVLTNPKELRIGLELKIPRAEPATAQTANMARP